MALDFTDLGGFVASNNQAAVTQYQPTAELRTHLNEMVTKVAESVDAQTPESVDAQTPDQSVATPRAQRQSESPAHGAIRLRY